MSEDYPLEPEAVEFCPACHGAGRYFCRFTQEYTDCLTCGGYSYVSARHYQQIKEALGRQADLLKRYEADKLKRRE